MTHRPRWLLTLVLLAATPANAQPQKIAAAGPSGSSHPMEAPYSLTAADGTGLKLVALDARAVVDGPLAFTELHLTFENPQPRVIEGHFKVTMPDGAAISRFAMKIRGAWMEGEVVEKQAARRAYEDALHRRQDPALLEQDSGNSFRARVFPIPANGRKEIIVSWSHTLTAAGEAYRLPLLGLPEVESLTLTALTSSKSGQAVKSTLGGKESRYQITRVEKRRFAPDQDWIVYGGDVPAGGDALRSGDLAVTRFAIQAGTAPEKLPAAVILFDTSASRAIGYAERLDALVAFVSRLPEIGVERVKVIAFDQTATPVFDGSPKDFAGAGRPKLTERGALGASDLSAALAVVASEKDVGDRLVLFSDGMVTAGEQDPQKLAEQVAALAGRGVQRLDAVVDTTARDPRMLDALVTARLPRAGKVVEGKAPLDDQLRVLGRRTLAELTVHVPGAKWIWPEKLRGAQDGDTVIVFADLPAAIGLAVDVTGAFEARVEPEVRETERPLLERAWVAARIERLMDMQTRGDVDLKAALKHQIIALSTRHRVLSRYTALVVLQTENEYRRFGIDRRALADILTIGPAGLEVISRAGQAVALRPPPPPPRTATVRRAPRKKRAKSRAPGGPRHAMNVATAPAEEVEAMKGGAVLDDAFGRRGSGAVAGAAPAMAAPVEKEVAADLPADGASIAGADEGEMGEAQLRAVVAPPARPAPRPSRIMIGRGDSPPPSMQIATGDKRTESEGRREFDEIAQQGNAALTGRLATVVESIGREHAKRALGEAKAWRGEDPTNLLALVALGRAYSAAGDVVGALRAFGSVLDLYPSRADMRRFAGNYLEGLGRPGWTLAADAYRVAADQRPDHPSIYHQLAMVLVKLGRYGDALDVVLGGLRARRVAGRFEGVERILMEDAQIIGAAWAAAEPARRAEIEERLEAAGLRIDSAESMRFVLTWETDANDVDFHIFDNHYSHAYYSRRALSSGGELYADITTGYGPECFTIFAPRAWPYRLRAHYYSRGPMGYGMGKLQILRHDGRGHLGFEERPFVIMSDGAYVDLGVVNTATAKPRSAPPQAIAH